MSSTQLQNLLRELKAELQKLYGGKLVTVILYGSYARGAAHQDSDLDIVMVLKNYERDFTEIDRTNEIAAQLSLDYDIIVALLPLREKDWRDKQSLFLQNLRHEGVEIL